ncbi:OsmC family protein [Streptomyces luteireticuli]|uniref:OsmC family protein n=1 Tax=Streptomyces luteireticuli TaxID=173858 RepID=UPI0035592221
MSNGPGHRTRRPLPAAHGDAPAPNRLTVAFTGGESYRVSSRGHEFTVDQPPDVGGNDLGPTPVDLFVASLAACIAFYAGRYLTRHGMPRDGLRVDAEFDMATDRPARVARVRVRLAVPPGLTEDQERALLAVVDHCTVHNSLRQPPDVHMELA